MRLLVRAVMTLVVALALATPAVAVEITAQTYTLPNGLTVILHQDHRLPQVTINTWFAVGSKDEKAGRTGFAHLFEHLMFMGTERVPGNQFDVLMETGGGANNASTAQDRTNYFSWGPSSLLPTLLWLDADRLEGLGKAMTAEKLDLQRDVVRNERRQNYENRPYGVGELLVSEAIYPASHPYHHPIIGSHADLEAATLQDVKEFFAAYYVPGNASLVVAGDFELEKAKTLIAQTFGAVPASPLPEHRTAAPTRLDAEVRRMATDDVSHPRLTLVWHSPAAYTAGDADMDLLALILADRSSGRLFERLVLRERLAQSVSVFQWSRLLGSEFRIEAMAAEGADLERIKRVVLEELERIGREGPGEAELKRAKATTEAGFLRRVESLAARADMLNEYRFHYGEAASFDRDLKRRLAPSAASVRDRAREVLGEGRLDLRILPAGRSVAGASLDARPPDLPERPAEPPTPLELRLANGVPLLVVPQPGSGLFAGALLAGGGESAVPAGKAGLASLAATMLTKGAAGRDAGAFADAVATLGASINARASWHDVEVSVSGLASRLEPTLDLFADALLRPTLAEPDFTREKQLALAAIRARADNPNAVASTVSRVLLFGREDPRGRPASGWAATVATLEHGDVAAALPGLLDPRAARLVFVGDFTPEALKRALDARLARWKATGERAAIPPSPLVEPPPGRLVLVHRPGAAQTVLSMLRPVTPADERGWAVRDALTTLFGGSFTSRLNQNIREKHGFSYGARSSISADGPQVVLSASSSVHAPVTGAALREFKREFDLLASANVGEEEHEKARRSVRYELATAAGTTGSLLGILTDLIADGRPLDALRQELAAVDALTLADLNGAAGSGLYDWSRLLVVLVGDREQVLPQLEKAGFPKPQLVDVEGNPL